jgi:site-specific DNA recombinase
MAARAAVYIRMSTDKQEDSPERQRTSIKQAIEREGFNFYREYIDEARRGWDDTRPEFRELLADAQERKFDIIVVDELSRLSRNAPLGFLAEVAHPLQQAGVRLYSVAEGGLQDWDTLTGVLLAAIHQDRSSNESKKISYRVTSEYLKRSRTGQIDLGKPPYGYMRGWVDTSGRVVHTGTYPPEEIRRTNPTPKLIPGAAAEVNVVQFIFHAYANRDMSLRDIGRELEAKGILTPAGKQVWSQNCVGRILREMKYAGHYVFNRVPQGTYHRLGADAVEQVGVRSKPTGTKSKENWRITLNHHEPLVSQELFDRVQALLSANVTRTTPIKDRGDFLLTKLLTCGSCGGPMVGHRNGRGKPAFYRCQRAMDTAQNHCRNNLVKESEVLDNVLAALEEQLLDARFLDLCVRHAEELDEREHDGRKVNALRSELASLNRDIDRASGRLTKEDDDSIYALLKNQLTLSKTRKKEVEDELNQLDVPRQKKCTEELLHWIEAEIRQLRASIHSKDRQVVRAVIRRLIGHVTVGVECRRVGMRNRYFLIGGDVVIEDGRGSSATRPSAKRRDGGDVRDVEFLATRGCGTGNDGGEATVSLSASEPRACPR